MVDHNISKESDSVLDPACGSGTFLVFALKRKAELLARTKTLEGKDIAVLLDQISGIDVNPVSVILSRTNLYLTSSSILRGRQQPSQITPHVYVADTFILPRFSDEEQRQLGESDGETRIVYVPVTPNITVPVLSTLTPEEVTKWVEIVGKQIELGIKVDVKSGYDKEKTAFIVALEKTMRSLQKKYGDNLW